MNKRIVLLTLALVLLSIGVGAQEKPQMLVVYEEMVKPSQLDAYVKASKEFGELMVAADPKSEWSAVQLEDYHFYWVIPLSGFAELDDFQQLMMKMMEKAGLEKFSAMMDASSKTTDHMDAFVVVERDDLSYHPETMIPREEAKVLEYSYYYLKPGKELEAEEVARQFVATMKAKGVESGFTLYQLAFGSDMPALATLVPARSLVELQQMNAAFMEKMGADGAALQKKVDAITRRFDRRIGFPRPDLSSAAFKTPEK